MPGRPRMPRPTTATSATPRSTAMRSMRRSRRSCTNASSSARTACAASASGSTKQMLASLDAWLIIDTEWPACDSAVKARPATPGTPIMPPPSMETRA